MLTIFALWRTISFNLRTQRKFPPLPNASAGPFRDGLDVRRALHQIRATVKSTQQVLLYKLAPMVIMLHYLLIFSFYIL
jgi:hypothetical protein